MVLVEHVIQVGIVARHGDVEGFVALQMSVDLTAHYRYIVDLALLRVLQKFGPRDLLLFARAGALLEELP